MAAAFGGSPTSSERAAMQERGAVSAVAKDVGVGAVEAGPAAIRGAMRGAKEMGQTVTEAVGADAATKWLDRRIDALTPPEASTVTGQIVEAVAQFAVGYAAAGRLLRLGLAGAGAVSTQAGAALQAFGFTKAGRASAVLAKDAIAGATAFDPHEQRLSNLIENYEPLRNPISEYLAADPADSAAEGRFKNAIENVLIGGPIEALYQTVRGLRAARTDRAAATQAAEDAEKALAEWRRTQAPPEGAPTAIEGPRQGTPESPGGPTIEGRADPVDVTPPPGSAAETPPGPRMAPVEAPKGNFSPEEVEAFAKTAQFITGDFANLPLNQKRLLYTNTERVLNDADAQRVRDMMGLARLEAVEKARGKPLSIAELEEWTAKELAKLADATGEEVNLIVQAAARDVTVLKDLAHRVAGYRALVELEASRVHELAKAFVRSDASEFGGSMDALKEALQKHMEILAAINPSSEGIKSNLGRNLSALRAKVGPGPKKDALPAPDAPPPAPAAAEKSGPLTVADIAGSSPIAQIMAQGDDAVRRLAIRLAIAGEPRQARRIVQAASENASLLDMHNEYFINSILSSPKTHIVNMMSAATKGFIMDPGERVLAGALQLDGKLMREAADQYVGMVLGLKDSVRLAAHAVRSGDAVLDTMTTYEYRAAIKADPSDAVGGFLNGLGALVRLPSRMLTAEDELFKQISYRGRVYAIAAREADALGLRRGSDEFAEYVAEALSQSVDGAGRSTNEAALLYARAATYTSDLPMPVWAKSGKSLGETMHSAVNAHPTLRIVLPFVRTPVNVLRDVVDHTPPAYIATARFWHDIKSGDAELRGKAMAKLTTGAGLWALAVSMAMDGQITGTMDKDFRLARQDQMLTGALPHSIRTVDEDGNVQWIQYSRFDPFGTVLSVAATYAETAPRLSQLEQDKMATTMLDALYGAIESKAFLGGVTRLLDALANSDSKGSAWLRSQFAAYIPALQRDIQGSTIMRQSHTILDAMKAKTSHSHEVDPRYNALGETVVTPGGWGSDDLSPFALSNKRDDAVADELARLGKVHRRLFEMHPTIRLGTGGLSVDLREFRGPSKRTAWSEYQELVGQIELDGVTLRERLSTLFSSPEYKKELQDGDELVDGSRLKEVNKILRSYRMAAREYFLDNEAQKYPGLTEKLGNATAKREALEKRLKAPETKE